MGTKILLMDLFIAQMFYFFLFNRSQNLLLFFLTDKDRASVIDLPQFYCTNGKFIFVSS